MQRMEISKLNIAVVGLGLMGGSLAMALNKSVGKLSGVDRDTETCRLAVAAGVVDEASPVLEHQVAMADLVVLAVPVRGIVAILNELPALRPGGCMVLDLGSAKKEIAQAMENLPDQFAAIGGHPMCGREHSGLSAATADLYERQTFVLCPNQRTTSSIEGIALALVHTLGAKPLMMTAERHDELVATSSHLPYVVASLLMRRAWKAAQEDETLWRVSASGLRDTTRLAGSDPQMMLEILLANRRALLGQIEAYRHDLDRLADLLNGGDEETLRHDLKGVQWQRAEYLRKKSGEDD